MTGVTSNPSIFEKAIGHGREYDADIAALVRRGRAEPHPDLRASGDHRHPGRGRRSAPGLRPAGRRGRLCEHRSLALSRRLDPGDDRRGAPALGRRRQAQSDGEGARHRAGVPAVRELTSSGVNVNITLLFAIDMYKAVAEAFIAGLEERVARGEDISRISSVASFFVSRIDTRIDEAIDARVKAGDAESEALAALRGKVAIANAKLAYQYYLELIASDRWQALAAKGARPQRLLWASTGTKDPAYSDVLYVETLIGRDTINTMPPKTIDAFLDHGVTSAIADGGHRGRAPGPVRGGTPGPRSRGRDGRSGRRGRRQIRGCRRRSARRDREDALRACSATGSTGSKRACPRLCKALSRTGLNGLAPSAGRGGCGRAMRHCGRAATRIDGSAGWQRAAAPPWTWKRSASSPPRRGNMRTSCCSAWADRASAPK